jgi:hypothetical protein
MQTICSSETSVEAQQITRRHIPEDDTLHNHRCENLKSYRDVLLWLYAQLFRQIQEIKISYLSVSSISI